MTRPQQPRIDLNHGYLQFIRRNQVDRDEFNKIHEQRKSEIRERLGEKKEEKEVQKSTNLYIPPHLRQRNGSVVAESAAMTTTTGTAKNASAARNSLSRSDSDSQEDEKTREKLKIDEDRIRRQVRRRIERTHPTVDDICVSLEKYRIEEAERSIETSDDELFTFELTLKTGDVKVINVPRNTQAARLAKSISMEHSFDDSQCRNLRLYLEEQLKKRIALEQTRRNWSPSSTVSTTTISSLSSSASSSLPTSPCRSSTSSSSSSASASTESASFSA